MTKHADPSDTTYWALLVCLIGVVAAAAAETWWSPPAGVTPAMWIGRALVVVGAAFTIWSRRVLGESYAPTARNLDPEQTFVRRGPYRVMKHPQYTGNVASLAGLILALGLTWSWLALLPFVVAMAARVRLEERFLREKFPDEC